MPRQVPLRTHLHFQLHHRPEQGLFIIKYKTDWFVYFEPADFPEITFCKSDQSYKNSKLTRNGIPDEEHYSGNDSYVSIYVCVVIFTELNEPKKYLKTQSTVYKYKFVWQEEIIWDIYGYLLCSTQVLNKIKSIKISSNHFGILKILDKSKHLKYQILLLRFLNYKKAL